MGFSSPTYEGREGDDSQVCVTLSGETEMNFTVTLSVNDSSTAKGNYAAINLRVNVIMLLLYTPQKELTTMHNSQQKLTTPQWIVCVT